MVIRALCILCAIFKIIFNSNFIFECVLFAENSIHKEIKVRIDSICFFFSVPSNYLSRKILLKLVDEIKKKKMNSVKEELSVLIDTALNLENIVDFKSLHKLLHEIVKHLGYVGSQISSDASVHQNPDVNISDSIDKGWVDGNRNLRNGNPVYLENSLKSLESRIVELENHIQNNGTSSRTNDEIFSGFNRNEENTALNSLLTQSNSQIQSTSHGNNEYNERLYENPVTDTSSEISGLRLDLYTLRNTIDHHSAKIAAIDNEILNIKANQSMPLPQESQMPESQVHLGTEKTTQTTSPSTSSVENPSVTRTRDSNIIPGSTFNQLTASSTHEEQVDESFNTRLNSLELKYSHINQKLEAVNCLRVELREKLSMEIFESAVTEWKNTSQFLEDRNRSERNQLKEKVESISVNMSEIEKKLMEDLKRLERLLAGQMLELDQKLAKIGKCTDSKGKGSISIVLLLAVQCNL